MTRHPQTDGDPLCPAESVPRNRSGGSASGTSLLSESASSAPLLKERERFLRRQQQQGTSRAALRNLSGELIHVVRLLRLRDTLPPWPRHPAATFWSISMRFTAGFSALERDRMRSRLACCSCARRGQSEAKAACVLRWPGIDARFSRRQGRRRRIRGRTYRNYGAVLPHACSSSSGCAGGGCPGRGRCTQYGSRFWSPTRDQTFRIRELRTFVVGHHASRVAP